MIRKVKIPEAYARVIWCIEHFGPSNQYTLSSTRRFNDLRWWRKKGHLFFRDEKDYLLYVLQWSDNGY